MDDLLSKITMLKSSCIIADDINIDLTKCVVNRSNAEYVEMLLGNNFLPLLVMPTRVTSRSATLIDHIYFFESDNAKKACYNKDW
jgi:predicted metal-dependent TIM-barrel fold hydrolase